MKKILLIILCMNLCLIPFMPVSAEEISEEYSMSIEGDKISAYASNYFTKPTIRLNSVAGSESRYVNISTGSVSGNIISISLYVRVINGSDPFKLCLQAPDGSLFWTVIEKTGTIDINSFDGKDLSGNWKMWIETLGISSTAEIKMKIYYNF
ncbi:hypothetical protein IMSAGC013_04094 [Lachnospiraceae bacterium]|nr:hypothetical protein IMSAGC013_04094 [Lachnospiraceae bacterium]